jgi:secreted PhoX family phosphatase
MTYRAPTLGEVMAERLSRREVLGGLAASVVLARFGRAADAGPGPRSPSSLGFEGLGNVLSPTHRVPPGYEARVLLRWGDPVCSDAPAFDAHALTEGAQSRQLGYDADFLAFLPLPRGSGRSDHGLLFVNHESARASLMWSGASGASTDPARIAVERAAHGASIVEIALRRGRWAAVRPGVRHRRLTPTTPVRLSGPAAGDRRLVTRADPTGRRVLGTLGNCSGGVTPWGTVLTAEENVDEYFRGDPAADPLEADNHRRMGMGEGWYQWHLTDERFDLGREPREPNRFGWIVEVDPYDPASVPVKRTALGRMKHEGATVVVNPDGRIVVYSGDDEAFQHLYRFVTSRPYVPRRPGANRDLLDHGALSVARFEADGTCRWLPLAFGQGPLGPANGFRRPADVLVEARRAASLVGATPLDRPEGIAHSSSSHRLYAMLTNNVTRTPDQVDAANPRPHNAAGHVLELIPPDVEGPCGAGHDHAASAFRWEPFLVAGDPAKPAVAARWHPDTGPDGWFACPDNATVDRRGRLWIATDGGAWFGIPDGVRALDTEGPGRALPRLFFAAPLGAEVCSPCFTPDERTLFVSVQHPGAGGPPACQPSTFDAPCTRWPDFDERVPPRPSVVAIRRVDGGVVGS